jgi:hypothetical protein
VETTELGNDGSIESVADSLIETPETPEVEEETNEIIDEEVTEEVEEEAIEDDGDDVDDEEEYDSHEETLTVKVDGQEVEVTLDELKRGYSGQKYIQKGMQEAAEQKKAIEAEYAKIQEQSQQLSSFLQAAQSGQLNLTPPTPPSRELFERDPIGYMDEKLKYEDALGQYQATMQQTQQVMAQQQQMQEQARAAMVQDELQKLVSIDPDFADPKRAGEVKGKMLDFAKNVGFTEDDIAGITDHRALLVLKKAALYDELTANAPKANEKASKARPFVKAGAKKSESSKAQKAKKQAVAKMKKSGSVDDVAKFLIS